MGDTRRSHRHRLAALSFVAAAAAHVWVWCGEMQILVKWAGGLAELSRRALTL